MSVTIIAYNGAAFIEEALLSIYDQTRKADEIIVLNDGSTDDTAAILTRHSGKITILNSSENRGALLSRRAVVEAASFDRVAFLDADDRFHPEALSSFEEAAESSPEADLIFGMMKNFYDLPAGGGKISHGGKWLHGRTNGNMLAKREAFLAASIKAQEAARSEYLAWYQSAQSLNLVEEQIDTPIFERRIHENNASRHPETRREMMTMLKTHLDRQRSREES
ncbi:MAG: glycosyltransferase family A protein [Verrucomicrobiales bacterium]|nr:glycosyltransferase family A protein [Verrucomicrobiales bacterium]